MSKPTLLGGLGCNMVTLSLYRQLALEILPHACPVVRVNSVKNFHGRALFGVSRMTSGVTELQTVPSAHQWVKTRGEEGVLYILCISVIFQVFTKQQ